MWETSGKLGKRPRSTTQPPILWVVKIDEEASDAAYEVAKKNESSARELLADKRRFRPDWFEWNAEVPSDLEKYGGNVMLVCKRGRGWTVCRSERFLRLERVPGFKRNHIVRLEERLPEKGMPLSALRSQNPNLGALIDGISYSKLVRAADSVRALLKLL